MNTDTLLVVDDEPAILDAYLHYLDPPPAPSVFRSSRSAISAPEAAGGVRYRLLRAKSGEQALELIRGESDAGRRVAAGFFDIKMPGGMDGVETIAAVRAVDPDILCAVVTAYNDRSVDEIARCFPQQRQDEWDYLNKPFTEGEIQQKARNLISSWWRRRREEALFSQLAQLNASLEQRIAERTAELEGMLAQLKDTQQQLVHSEKFAVLGQTAATIAHEINNPATFLQVNLEELGDTVGLAAHLCRLLDSGASPSTVRAWREQSGFDRAVTDAAGMVTECLGGLGRILTIVRDLRGFARSGDPSVDLRLVDAVDRALRIMGNEIRHRAAVRQVRREPVIVRADEGRLIQVLLNLLGNALHAFGNRPASENVLEVSVWQEGKRAWFALRDNGCGIPAEIRKKIFEPFFTTKPVGQGTGLGLGICRAILEQHGGTIAVNSEPGQGSEFRFELPSAG
jgi:two-component system NtrC family sensor kinase